MKFIATLTIVGLCFIASPSAAEFMDGNDLHALCIAKEGDAAFYQKNASCRSYIIGALDDYTLELMLAQKASCIPPNATRGQMADVVAKYLNDEPAKRTLPAAALVRIAMSRAFKCALTRD